MRQEDPAKEKFFERLKDGDGHALAELLEGERPGVFDYCLRMTGQVSKSTDTVDEVYLSLNEDVLDTLGSYTDFKICLYLTARRFISDIWNADTTKLMNAAIEGTDGDGGTDRANRERAAFRVLDKSVRGLPGRQRETLLLRVRAGFEWDEIAQILGAAPGQAEADFAAALAHVERECPGTASPEGAAAAVARMPAHPEPVRSSQRTINLSMVMQGIKAKPVGLWSPVRITVIAVLVVVVAILLFKPGLFQEMFAALKALAGGGEKSGT